MPSKTPLIFAACGHHQNFVIKHIFSRMQLDANGLLGRTQTLLQSTQVLGEKKHSQISILFTIKLAL